MHQHPPSTQPCTKIPFLLWKIISNFNFSGCPALCLQTDQEKKECSSLSFPFRLQICKNLLTKRGFQAEISTADRDRDWGAELGLTALKTSSVEMHHCQLCYLV